MLTGNIPESLCNLTHLHVLDLSYNNLSDHIPPCLGNMTGFKAPSPYVGGIPTDDSVVYTEHMDLFMKGVPLEYTTQMHVVNFIDLSRNNLSGEIPQTLTGLSYLGSLNLSWNQLTGNIPANIAALHQLESLDLSDNHLSGTIPPNMTTMTFLSHLNLSHNNLSGEIPVSNQFQTFTDPSIYENNPLLCGTPLPTKCSEAPDEKDNEVNSEKSHERLWFSLSVVLGFFVGFWGVCVAAW